MSTPVGKKSCHKMDQLTDQHRAATASLAKAISADEKSTGEISVLRSFMIVHPMLYTFNDLKHPLSCGVDTISYPAQTDSNSEVLVKKTQFLILSKYRNYK